MTAPLEAQYAQSGELSIAYQTIGDGPIDVLLVPGFVSNIELMWEIPMTARQLERLSRIGRLIVFDKRGTGCSDRSMGTGSAEERMDDLRAVADAAGVESANVIGMSEGGPLAVLFATTFPERVRSLVLWGTYARGLWAPDYENGASPELVAAFIEDIRSKWGTGHALARFARGVDGELLPKLARYERQTASPNAAATILHHNVSMDVRHALNAIRVPTLIVHRTNDPIVPVVAGQYLAQHIRDARYVELPGNFHVATRSGDDDDAFDAIEEFVTGALAPRDDDVALLR